MAIEADFISKIPDNFHQKAGELAPDWLQKIGSLFDIGIAIIDRGNQVHLHNKSFIEQCGIPVEIINKSRKLNDWFAFMENRGDFRKDSPKDFLEKIHSGLNQDARLENITPSNGKFINFSFLPSKDGIVSVFSRDVTEQQRNEECLEHALEIGQSGYFYHVIETGETIRRCAWLDQMLSPSEKKQIDEEGLWPMFHPNEMARAKTLWRTAVLNGQRIEAPLKIRTQNAGERIFKFTVKPLQSTTGVTTRVIGFFDDVTHEHKVRASLKTAKEETELSLKSKTDFLARISHEIRTPMNAVIGIADALIHHNKNPDIVPKLELIQSSADGILNILDDTLHHAKLSTDEFKVDPKPGNPRKSIESVCALWESKAVQNKTTINCVLDNNVPHEINFDRYRYEQCLNNLLSNAIKFTPGGKIDVVAARTDKNGQSRLTLAVRDNGIGMTEEQSANIFKAFKQGDQSIAKRFGGTGLGMNITKSLIEKMGGTISVRSSQGKGTIFVLNLPIQTEAKDNQPPLADIQVSEQTESPYERLRVLVADDNATNHLVVKSLLDGVVAEIYTAIDGQDALSVMETVPIDIILMDIHMPIMDGIEATLAIRSSHQSWSDVIIIALTADPEYQQKRLCLNIGMDYAVAKPVKLVDLLDAFDNVLSMKNAKQYQRKIA